MKYYKPLKFSDYWSNFPHWIELERVNWHVHTYCERLDVDAIEILALIETESAGNKHAVRYEPNYMWLRDDADVLAKKWHVTKATAVVLQKFSYGLCQIVGANFYGLGIKNIPSMFFDIELNVLAGVKFWIRMRDKWGDNPIDIYAAYNAGSVRKVGGRYINANNVFNYKSNYEKIKKLIKS